MIAIIIALHVMYCQTNVGHHPQTQTNTVMNDINRIWIDNKHTYHSDCFYLRNTDFTYP